MVTWMLDRYREQIVDPGKQPLFLLLTGLLGTFLFIRTSTRLIRAEVPWWPGNVTAGSVHVHHELIGFVLMLTCGIPSFVLTAAAPWRDLLALGFGVGAGLALDEFALLLHLKDVYWSNEGRSSIDAVVVVVASTLMIFLGSVPFGLSEISGDERSARWVAVSVVAGSLTVTVITALKGKVWTALLSIAIPVVGVVGALRLATPVSPWARWRYRSRPRLAAKAERRDVPWARRRGQLRDLLGGTPSLPAPPAAD